jgi:hypothetical protein
MIITIHLLVLYFIECYHYASDIIHSYRYFDKKISNTIQNEKKEREEKHNN